MFNILIVDNFHQVFSGPILVMYGLLFGPKFALFKATPTEVGQYKFAMFKATPTEVGQYKFAMFKATPCSRGRTIQVCHV